MTVREQWILRMRPLREQGMTHTQIAAALGCKKSLVRNYLSDPDGSKQRERRRRAKNQESRGPMIPADRVRPLLRAWIDDYNQSEQYRYVTGSRGGINELARRARFGERNLRAILNGEVQSVTLFTVDKLLCAMDRIDLWHTTLADIYERQAA